MTIENIELSFIENTDWQLLTEFVDADVTYCLWYKACVRTDLLLTVSGSIHHVFSVVPKLADDSFVHSFHNSVYYRSDEGVIKNTDRLTTDSMQLIEHWVAVQLTIDE